MSRREPLVYVTRSAQERARTIVSSCPETAISRAIARGDVRFENGTAHIQGDGWEAVATRGPGALRPSPRAWRVSAVRRAQPTGTEE